MICCLTVTYLLNGCQSGALRNRFDRYRLMIDLHRRRAVCLGRPTDSFELLRCLRRDRPEPPTDRHSYNIASYHARAICDSEILTLIALSSRASRASIPARAAWAN